MKKGLIALALIIGVFTMAAHAQNYGFGNGNGGWGHGMGWGNGGHGMGHGGCWGNGNWNGNNGNWNGNNGNYQAPQITINSKDDASKAVADYLAEANLKGYKLGDVESYNTPRGMSMYTVEATDAGGNAFIFAVSPYGWVRGPMQNN